MGFTQIFDEAIRYLALVSAFSLTIAFAYCLQIGVFLVIVHVGNPP
jgi:hypothetical protein